MRKCFLSKNYKDVSSAGNKAKTDIEQIMEELDYYNVGFPRTVNRNKVVGFFITLAGILKAPFSMKRDSLLVLQYPLKKYYTFVCRMARFRGCRVVTVIHDLGSFRRQKLTVKQEIDRLNHSDYIIAHNAVMKRWLEENGCRARIGCLEIFDYLSVGEARKQEPKSPFRVIYAGALSPRKNRFLYQLDDYVRSYRFNLYGNGFEPNQIGPDQKTFFTYKGFVPSDRLITSVDGDFGLVWDGADIDTCSGNFGEYLQYNNPHKTSLYIRCELPVIIWEKAALASFVRENGIGITIASLEQLDEILSGLSRERYDEMKANVIKISKRLSGGYYFSKAMDAAELALS